MNDTDQLALIYGSSILLEDAAARKAYLHNKYDDILGDAEDACGKRNGGKIYRDPSMAASREQSKRSFKERTIDFIVDVTDPTHGKYSEWLVRQVIQYFTAAATTGIFPRYNSLEIIDGEDAYKVNEALTMFDRHKHTLPPDKRDINRYTIDQITKMGRKWLKADPTNAQLEKKIKAEQTIKLVDNVDGWTVITPLTKESAKLYGAGTRWCTSARGANNAFDDYDPQGPLIIFIGPNEAKYQFHVDLEDEDAIETFDFADDEDQGTTTQHVPNKIWHAVAMSLNALSQDRYRNVGTWIEEELMSHSNGPKSTQ